MRSLEWLFVGLVFSACATLDRDDAESEVVSPGNGNGADGPLAVSGTQHTDDVRTAVAVTANAGATAIDVVSAAGLAPADEVIVIQMDGTGAGAYETSRLASIAGNRLTLVAPLTATYTAAPSKAQVIRVPNYTNVSIPSGATLTVHPWDGVTGGVMFFRANGTVTVDGTLTVSGAGFAGGNRSGGGGGGSGGTKGNGGKGFKKQQLCNGSTVVTGDQGNPGGTTGNGGNGGAANLAFFHNCRGGKGARGGGLGAPGSAAQPANPGSGIGGGGANGGGATNLTPNDLTLGLMGGGGGGGRGGTGANGAGGGGGGGGNGIGTDVAGQAKADGMNGIPGGLGALGGDGGIGGAGGGILFLYAARVEGSGVISADAVAGDPGTQGRKGGTGGRGGDGANVSKGGPGGGGGGGNGGTGGQGGGGGGGGAGGVVAITAGSLAILPAQATANGGAGGARGTGGLPGDVGLKGIGGQDNMRGLQKAADGVNGTSQPGSPGVAGNPGGAGVVVLATAAGAPTAVAGGPYCMTPGVPVQFDGTASSDPDGQPLTFAWTFGDTGTGTGPTPTHTYQQAGIYTVVLTVTDPDQLSGSDQTIARSNLPPVSNPGGPYTGNVNLPVQFDGTASSDPEGEPLSFIWHFEDGQPDSNLRQPTYTFTAAGTYPITLRIIDSCGASDVDVATATISP